VYCGATSHVSIEEFPRFPRLERCGHGSLPKGRIALSLAGHSARCGSAKSKGGTSDGWLPLNRQRAKECCTSKPIITNSYKLMQINYNSISRPQLSSREGRGFLRVILAEEPACKCAWPLRMMGVCTIGRSTGCASACVMPRRLSPGAPFTKDSERWHP
jgi:hypothetical protein